MVGYFLLGMFAGWCLGFVFWLLVLSLCKSAGDADDQLERMERDRL